MTPSGRRWPTLRLFICVCVGHRGPWGRTRLRFSTWPSCSRCR